MTPAQRENESGRLPETGEKLNKHLEALLNDIDDVLEENAEEFVKGCIQRGGVAGPRSARWVGARRII